MLDYLSEKPAVARETIKATLGAAHNGDGVYAATAGSAADLAVTVDTTAVVADIAALVADGATPTQGHVNTLNTDWATLLAAINAQQATVSGDLIVSIDTAVLTTSNKVMAAIRAALQALKNRGMISV